MKNSFRIVVTGSKSILTRGFVIMLNTLGHIASEISVIELQSAFFEAPNLPQLILIATTKSERHEIETKLLKRLYPDIPVIIIILDEDIKDVIRGIKAGVHGYVLATIEPPQLDKAIQIVAGSHDFFFDLTNETLIYSDKKDINNPVKKMAAMNLPAKGQEFLRLLTTELSYEEIAQKMKLASRTVQGYKENISSVLKIKSRVGLVLFATKNNLFDPG